MKTTTVESIIKNLSNRNLWIELYFIGELEEEIINWKYERDKAFDGPARYTDEEINDKISKRETLISMLKERIAKLESKKV